MIDSFVSNSWIEKVRKLIFCTIHFQVCRYFCVIQQLPDMLSGTKVAGQLRKNSSGHAT